VLLNQNEWREVFAMMLLGYAHVSTNEPPKLRPHQQDEIVTMVSTGNKTAPDAARLFNVHPATVSRLLAKAGAEAIRV
jgi:hypothetical protein